ncbi:MAG TPA: 30S ribosomal protein S6 [Rhodothermales bacterium]|nr:30S ribosomal protein S6 [Rhodothermales bacterium]
MAQPVNTYELTYIVNGVLSDNQTKEAVARINRFIEEHGGNVLETDEWGTRRLAYPIRKKRNGYYVNLYFQSAGDIITRLERSLEIDDDILRYITFKLDAKMLRHYEQQKSSAKRARAQEIDAAAAGRDDDDD